MVIFDNPATVPAPAGGYSHVARVELGDRTLLQLSGQVAIDADRKIVGGNDMAAQADFIMDNITAILAAHGASLADVVNIRTSSPTWASFPSTARYGRRASPGPRRPSQRWRCPVCGSPARSLRSRFWPLPEPLKRNGPTAVVSGSPAGDAAYPLDVRAPLSHGGNR